MSSTAVTKPVLPPLQTPRSASFPSEICSTPVSACLSAFIKQEADLRTPITPPTAYTDFLKALTPILASPPPSALNRTLSDDSNVSKDSVISNPSTGGSSFSGRSNEFKSPTYPPPTPHSAKSTSRRTTMSNLHRLRIPQQHSPIFSPTTATGPSPRTALSGVPSSALYSPFSPADWSSSRMFESITTPRSACSKPVSVRSVVTRTVTYKRTTPNLEPAPRGKRRKTTSVASSIRSMTGETSSDDECDHKMPPPPPLISIKESTPEEEKVTTKTEPESIIPAAIPTTAAEA